MEKKYKIDINTQIEPLLEDVNKNFEKIIELCRPLIIFTISNVNYHPPITKEELFQESTIELWRICKKYKKISVSFSAYFLRDLKPYLINYIRKNQYVVSVSYYELQNKKYEDLAHLINGMGGIEDAECIESNENIEKNVYEFEDDRLTYIKEHLSKTEWELLHWVVVEEKTLKNYGKKYGISDVAACKRWKKLRSKLGISLD